MAQSVGCWTLDFSSGHDPRALGSSPPSGSMLSVETALDCLSLPLPLFSTPALSLSLSKRKKKNSKVNARKLENLEVLFKKEGNPHPPQHTQNKKGPEESREEEREIES